MRKPNKSLAGIRAKAAARLLDGDRVLAEEMGEVQFTDYGLSGICIMQPVSYTHLDVYKRQ